MRSVLPLWLLASLLVVVGAHASLLVGLVRGSPPYRYRGLVALLLPPLAPYFGFLHGMRKRSFCWLLGVFAYALGVAFANL
jgi:hypothetical protein